MPDANERLLMALLDRSKDTEYGKKFGFADIETREEFRRRCPFISDADLQEYVHRIGEGATSVLCPAQPQMLGETSGTSGTRKLLPVEALQQSAFFTESIPQVFHALFSEIPGCMSLRKSCKLMYVRAPSGRPAGRTIAPRFTHKSLTLALCA